MALHGTLVDVAGVGVLLLGPSGIGKSECALELLRRGHRLVADDVVELELEAGRTPVGRAAPQIGHHIEIRGLGILSVPDLFGGEAVQPRARIDLACRLRRPSAETPGEEFDRVGIERPSLEIAPGAWVPLLTLPAHPAGTLATLVEVGARDQVLRASGTNAAARFDAALRAHMETR